MISIEFSCPLPNGLHARPAWALKEQCSVWRSDIRFINNRLNTQADAKSSLALISTGPLIVLGTSIGRLSHNVVIVGKGLHGIP